MPFSRYQSACLALPLFWAMTLGAATPTPVPSAIKAHPAKVAKVPMSQLVDVNSAPREALLKLPGITPALADQIISHRPYLSKAKLVTTKVIPLATFQMIREYIKTMPVKK